LALVSDVSGDDNVDHVTTQVPRDPSAERIGSEYIGIASSSR